MMRTDIYREMREIWRKGLERKALEHEATLPANAKDDIALGKHVLLSSILFMLGENEMSMDYCSNYGVDVDAIVTDTSLSDEEKFDALFNVDELEPISKIFTEKVTEIEQSVR